MPRTVIYSIADRAILAIDPRVDAKGIPVLPTDPPCAFTDVSDAEAAKFLQANGGLTLSQDLKTVTVVAVPAANPVEVEKGTALSDFRTQYQAASNRLDQIIGAASPTNAQVVAAIQDEATILKRMLRMLASILT